MPDPYARGWMDAAEAFAPVFAEAARARAAAEEEVEYLTDTLNQLIDRFVPSTHPEAYRWPARR